ncbi:MAG: cell division protein Fic [marine bacterium B5-7]|nr:MAG: cell division protein Fic [marine bacterium B5-7]
MTNWIWKNKDWPNFYWDERSLAPLVAKVRLSQGKLLGITQAIYHEAAKEMDALILAEQAVETSAIEGEHLNRDSVRSSIANRLGLRNVGIETAPDRYVEGLLDMLLDATEHYEEPLSLDRLQGWHAALFPTGYSGIQKITVGKIREINDMQIVSGRPEKRKIHYEAPPSMFVTKDITTFIDWFNHQNKADGLIRAGIAHLWFELLHPFEDGNGRVGRAIIDLALAQDEKNAVRYYSLSSAMMKDRKSYYKNLELACRGNMDITKWLTWFLSCIDSAIFNSLQLIESIQLKARFWEKHLNTQLNQRQKKVLNRLLNAGKDGFMGDMTNKKYMHLTKTSRATAYRELKDLVSKECLKPIASGRSAAYEIIWP